MGTQGITCPPPLPAGLRYLELEGEDRGADSDGFFSAKLSDGKLVHWAVDTCWGAGARRPHFRGTPTVPLSKYFTDMGVSHAANMKAVVYKGGYYRVRDNDENYIWHATGSDVHTLKCDSRGNIVVLLEDGSIHHEGSDLMKFVDKDWRYSRLVEVEEGPYSAACLAGITRSGMAVQLTADVEGFPSNEMLDAAVILPVPGGVVESIRSVKDNAPLGAANRHIGRGSRIAYETTIRLPPKDGSSAGEVVRIHHLSPKATCGASRLANIPSRPADAVRTENYSMFTRGANQEEWVQMMVEAVSNCPAIMSWLPGSLRKHPRMRGIKGLLKL